MVVEGRAVVKVLVNLVNVLLPLAAMVVETFSTGAMVGAMLGGIGRGASVWFNKGTNTSSGVDVLEGSRPVAEVNKVV